MESTHQQDNPHTSEALASFASLREDACMVKRWIIRSIFMLPILLCVGGWGWSFGHWNTLEVAAGKLHRLGLENAYGCLWVHYFGGGLSSGFWWVGHGSIDSVERCIVPRWKSCFLGFSYWHEPLGWRMPIHWQVMVPYWFLILVFAGLLYFVWRKTGKPKPAGAFPVEVHVPPATTSTGQRE